MCVCVCVCVYMYSQSIYIYSIHIYICIFHPYIYIYIYDRMIYIYIYTTPQCSQQHCYNTQDMEPAKMSIFVFWVFFFYYFTFGVQLLYNVIFKSVVQQSESAVCIHIPSPSSLCFTLLTHPTPLGHHRAALCYTAVSQ